MRPVVVETTITLASAPADVWPLITDTDRTNRLLMGAAAQYEPIEKGAKTSARFVVKTKAAGFDLEYEEAPFEWTVNKRFSVYRKMRSGPLTAFLALGLAVERKRSSMKSRCVRRYWTWPIWTTARRRASERTSPNWLSLHARDSISKNPSGPKQNSHVGNGIWDLLISR